MEETRNLTSTQEIMEEGPYRSGSIQYIDSQEVAEMVRKEHSKLLRISKYIPGSLQKPKLDFLIFFIESHTSPILPIQPFYGA